MGVLYGVLYVEKDLSGMPKSEAAIVLLLPNRIICDRLLGTEDEQRLVNDVVLCAGITQSTLLYTLFSPINNFLFCSRKQFHL